MDRWRGRVGPPKPLNAISLKRAVLCAECDVVTDSPHDRCMVCGSSSLFNISRLLGGDLPEQRAMLVEGEAQQTPTPEFVLTFPMPHRIRRKASA